MGISKTIVSMILVLVVTISGIYFLIQFSAANNPSSLALQGTGNITQYSGRLNSSISDFTSNINTATNNLYNESGVVSTLFSPFLIIRSAFTIPKSFLNVLVSGIGIITDMLLTSIFGGNTSSGILIAGAIGAIFAITVIFLVLRTVRTGQD